MTEAVTTRHELKVWREPFVALWMGLKTFELRKDDRGFHLGDTLCLREYDEAARDYTGRSINATVTYLIPSDHPTPWSFAMEPGWVIMALHEQNREEE